MEEKLVFDGASIGFVPKPTEIFIGRVHFIDLAEPPSGPSLSDSVSRTNGQNNSMATEALTRIAPSL